MEARDAKLLQMRVFRRLENSGNVQKPRWSTKIYKVASIEGGVVTDTEGGEALAKEVLAILAATAELTMPAYTSTVYEARAAALQTYAEDLAQALAGRPDILLRTAAAEMRRGQPGFEEERKRQRVQNFAAFLRFFLDIFRAGKVTARRQRTLAARPEPQQLRRLRRAREAPKDHTSLDGFR